MLVKIGDTWFSSKETPICVQLNTIEKRAVMGMQKTETKLGAAPEGKFETAEQLLDWME